MLVLLWSREDVHNNDKNSVLSIQHRLLIAMSANNEPPVKRIENNFLFCIFLPVIQILKENLFQLHEKIK